MLVRPLAENWSKEWAVGQRTQRLSWPETLGEQHTAIALHHLKQALKLFPVETGLG